MSTKTTFKRVALTAVAALGLGLLSAIPSQSAVPAGQVAITSANGTAGRNDVGGAAHGKSDSTTAGTLTVTYARTSIYDSVIVTSVAKSRPTGAGSIGLLLQVSDTTSSTMIDTITMSSGAANFDIGPGYYPTGAANETGTSAKIGGYAGATASGTSVTVFKAFLDSTVASRVPGTYTFTVTVTPYGANSYTTVNGEQASAKSVDVSIVVSAGSATASAATSTAYINSGTSYTTANDSVVSAAATASTTPVAVIRLTLKSSTGSTATAEESVTVVTNVGSTGTTSGVAVGKNTTYKYSVGSPLDIYVYADGTVGTATITVSTTNTSFTKNVTFYSTTATKLTVLAATDRAAVGSNTLSNGAGIIWVKATDANGNTVVADADGNSGVWAYSSSSTVISDSGTSCTYSSALGYHTCAVTGVAAGTATITIASYSKGLANATLKGDKTVSLTVGSGTAAKVELAFNKATYAPGEKGYILVKAKAADGTSVNPGSYANLLAAGGITASTSFSGASTVTLTNTDYTIKPRVGALDDGLTSTEPVAYISFFAPYSGDKLTITATGGSLLPAAGQVSVTASASIGDNATAALAAVTALASQVSAFITKINAQITTLTDLVMKIQKKVKA